MKLLGTIVIGNRPYEIVGTRDMTADERNNLYGCGSKGWGWLCGSEFRLRPVGWVETAEDMEGRKPPELQGSGVDVSAGAGPVGGGTVTVKGNP